MWLSRLVLEWTITTLFKKILPSTCTLSHAGKCLPSDSIVLMQCEPRPFIKFKVRLQEPQVNHWISLKSWNLRAENKIMCHLHWSISKRPATSLSQTFPNSRTQKKWEIIFFPDERGQLLPILARFLPGISTKAQISIFNGRTLEN